MWNRGRRFGGINLSSFGQRWNSREHLGLNMITNSFGVIWLTGTYFALCLVFITYQINFWTRSRTCSLMICIWYLQFVQVKLKRPISSSKSNCIAIFWLKWFWWTYFLFIVFLLENSSSHDKIWFFFCGYRHRISRWSWCLRNDRCPSLAEIARNCCCFLIKLN